ncbi:YybH family protein [Alkalicoccobacillus murimartini]|uniref:Ketosteroid isomerase-like protein n=1 Tax=Alkalicoccobacillus murimartini TaxID=171685 RepID=A0ABT9YC04_9BACI|nr:nuclear transport factor 2 family protein [Alkalicoccobacillus murimartini]MDQ0205372.1 ketosteroid isomerase-like protein [Alkalicoccobacillus murimartini]
MSHKHALEAYLNATNTHDFKEVAKLLHPDAIYWFTDKTCDSQKAIEQYFKNSWDLIKEEVYSASDIHWITSCKESATCMYTYHYQGYYEGSFVSGSGRATNVFVFIKNEWKLIHEYLSSFVSS